MSATRHLFNSKFAVLRRFFAWIGILGRKTIDEQVPKTAPSPTFRIIAHLRSYGV